MKPKVWFILIVLCALMLVFGSPTGSLAAEPPLAPNAQGSKGDPETFRAWLMNYFADLQAVYPQTKGKVPAGFTERIKTGQQVVAKLTTQELDMLKDVFDKNPSLASAPKDLLNAMKQEAEARKARKAPKAAGADCPPGVEGGKIVLYVFKGIELGLTQAIEFVPGDMVVVGTTISVHPAKLVLAIIKDVAQWIQFAFEIADEVNGDCEQNNAQAVTVENLDTTITSRASEATLTQHDTDIKSRVTAMKAQLSQHDTAVKAQLSQHDTAMKAQLSQHDTAMKALLSQHDADIKKLEANVQKTLDQQVEQRRVTLQVMAIQGNWQFLVSATEAGQPLDNVQFIAIQASAANPLSFADVTAKTVVAMPTKGVYLVTMPKALVAKASLYTFSVKHANGVANYFGFTLFAL